MGKRDDLEIVIAADVSGLSADLGKTTQMVKKLHRDIESSAPKPDAFRLNIDTRGVREAAKSARNMKHELREASVSLSSLASKATLAGGALLALGAGYASVNTAVALAKDSLNLAAEAEQNQMAFETMLKSAEGAKAMLAGLRKYASETAFSQSDVTSAARQLIGYDTAADQVIPTVRMLGDVAAGSGKSLSELTYLYGTLMNQDRAYTVDIKQFATAGIPIWKELAKVMGKSTEEMRDFVEEGKVGTQDVKRAFLSMTGPGGIYHGLTARAGETFAGLREQMADSFQVLQTKFGQSLIDNLRLKDASRDLAAFAQNLEQHLPKIEPAIRFVGDLGRGVAQLSYEFSKAAIHVTELNLDGLATVSPDFANAIKEAKQFVAGLKDFRLDEEQVANFGIQLFKGNRSRVYAGSTRT